MVGLGDQVSVLGGMQNSTRPNTTGSSFGQGTGELNCRPPETSSHQDLLEIWYYREYSCLLLECWASPCSETSLVLRTDLRHCVPLPHHPWAAFPSCNVNMEVKIFSMVSSQNGKGWKLCVPAGWPGRKVSKPRAELEQAPLYCIVLCTSSWPRK